MDCLVSGAAAAALCYKIHCSSRVHAHEALDVQNWGEPVMLPAEHLKPLNEVCHILSIDAEAKTPPGVEYITDSSRLKCAMALCHDVELLGLDLEFSKRLGKFGRFASCRGD